MSNKYQEKPQHKGYQTAVEATCDYCGVVFWETKCSYKRKKRHFCAMGCYAAYRREIMPPNEQPTWRGGISNTEAHRRWKKKNPEHIWHFLKLDGTLERRVRRGVILLRNGWNSKKDVIISAPFVVNAENLLKIISSHYRKVGRIISQIYSPYVVIATVKNGSTLLDCSNICMRTLVIKVIRNQGVAQSG